MSFIYTAIKSLFYTSDELYHPAEIFDVSSDVIDASGQIKETEHIACGDNENINEYSGDSSRDKNNNDSDSDIKWAPSKPSLLR